MSQFEDALPVQPRVRGERATDAVEALFDGGSAPRARGTGSHAGGGRRASRFSPACAGNGGRGLPEQVRSPVQPRVRGERRAEHIFTKVGNGSAPRARGTGRSGPNPGQRQRFSPACAGNGMRAPRINGSRAVQPRVRGERAGLVRAMSSMDGSAPRARGTGFEDEPSGGDVRFSPACAGNGPIRASVRPSTAVQPRVRGERSTVISTSSPKCGSAPRARGTGLRRQDEARCGRFSPACAGNGNCLLPTAVDGAVQPRVRGERWHSTRIGRSRAGSAPRARGTGGSTRDYVAIPRFSPACAGNGSGK